MSEPVIIPKLEEARRWVGDRTAVLATMHAKQVAIAPALAPLGIEVVVPKQLNTDRMGTFTRTVQRPGSQLETARLKALRGLEGSGQSLGLASEGSFGPHPLLPYLPCGRELVLLLDQANGLEVVGQDLTTETNYRQQTVTDLDAALQFAASVGFPAHGLVLMPEPVPTDSTLVFKGITQPDELQERLAFLLQRYGQAHLETDMRAMMNPTRMQAIARAAQNLAQNLQQLCPECGTPGFVERDRRPGLPCGWCGAPTGLTLTAVFRCQKCGAEHQQRYPDGLQTADPGQCAYCNP